MADQLNPTIFLTDYTPPAYLVDTVRLHFELDPTATRVKATTVFQRNPQGPGGPLVLTGEQLELLTVKLDDRQLTPSDYVLDSTSLSIARVP